ncbi:germin 2-1 [Olea europaea subsp. europaea]|uniref:Germin-like protein n=1 Tax=Olea europaea subsp. europaea TaxID=158383 RepID=A0A8S0UHH3_OLEEU|nr:germin 2-1 [Olea europaea subsp. europaea]
MIVAQLPGLNSLGILMVRTDYAPWRLNPPHTHPKATEILIVLEGSLHFGFVTSNLDNSHITKVLQKGNVFVFPGAVFGSKPDIANDLLAKAFQVDKSVVDQLQANF